MKTLKIGLCIFDENNNVISSRTLTSKWHANLDEELREKFGLEIENEIASLISENITKEDVKECLVEMLKEIK